MASAPKLTPLGQGLVPDTTGLPLSYKGINQAYADYLKANYLDFGPSGTAALSYPDINPAFSTPDTREELPPTAENLAKHYPEWATLDPTQQQYLMENIAGIKPAAGPYGLQIIGKGTPTGTSKTPTPIDYRSVISPGYFNLKGPSSVLSFLSSRYGTPSAQNYQSYFNFLNQPAGSPYAIPRVQMAYQAPSVTQTPIYAPTPPSKGGMTETWSPSSNLPYPYWNPKVREEYGMGPMTTEEQRTMGDWYISRPSLQVPDYVANILPLGVLGVGKAPLGTPPYEYKY